MSEIIIHNPHDGFFKHSLSNLTVAKDLLQAHLSPSITQRIQWNSLRLSHKSYTDEKLKQLHSDVVYTCQIDKKSAYIYLLIEQQTTPDPLLPFRFLEYNVAMLSDHLAQQKEKKQATRLPIILNLCLYSGKKTPYPYSIDIYDCFEDPILARAELFKPLSLIDLGQIDDEELKKHGTADLMELLLKQSRARTFLKWIKDNPEATQRLLVRFYGKSGIVYILGVEAKHTSEEVIEAIIAVAPHKKEDIMTALQQLEQKSEIRGMQQGMQEEKLHIAKNMLQSHEPKEKIHQFTGLSWVEIEQLMREQEKSKK